LHFRTGIGRGAPGVAEANDQIAHALKMEGMEILGQLQAVGNPECLVCGFGESCCMSGLPWVFGEDTAVTPEKFCRVEDQEVWGQAQ
jgi:hypothetical protein